MGEIIPFPKLVSYVDHYSEEPATILTLPIVAVYRQLPPLDGDPDLEQVIDQMRNELDAEVSRQTGIPLPQLHSHFDMQLLSASAERKIRQNFELMRRFKQDELIRHAAQGAPGPLAPFHDWDGID